MGKQGNRNRNGRHRGPAEVFKQQKPPAAYVEPSPAPTGAARFQPSQAYLARQAASSASAALPSGPPSFPPPPPFPSASYSGTTPSYSSAPGQPIAGPSSAPYLYQQNAHLSTSSSYPSSTSSSRAGTPSSANPSQDYAYRTTQQLFPPPQFLPHPPSLPPLPLELPRSPPPNPPIWNNESPAPALERRDLNRNVEDEVASLVSNSEDGAGAPRSPSPEFSSFSHPPLPFPLPARAVSRAVEEPPLSSSVRSPPSEVHPDAEEDDGESYVSDDEIQAQLLGNTSRISFRVFPSASDEGDQAGEDGEGSEMSISSDEADPDGEPVGPSGDEFELYHESEEGSDSDDEDEGDDQTHEEGDGGLTIDSSEVDHSISTDEPSISESLFRHDPNDSSLPLPPSPPSLPTNQLPSSSSRKRKREADDESDHEDSCSPSRSPSLHDDEDEDDGNDSYEEGEIPDFFTTTIKASKLRGSSMALGVESPSLGDDEAAWEDVDATAGRDDSGIAESGVGSVDEGEAGGEEEGEGEEDMDMSFADLPADLVGDPSKRSKGKIVAVPLVARPKASYTRKEVTSFSPATPVHIKSKPGFKPSYKPSPLQPPTKKAIYTRPSDSSISSITNSPLDPTPPTGKAVYERPAGALATSKVNNKPPGALPLTGAEKASRLPTKFLSTFPEEFADVEEASSPKIFAPVPKPAPAQKKVKGPSESCIYGFWPAPPRLSSAKATYPAPAVPDVDPEEEKKPGLHIFVDHSNILYSFLNWARERPEAKIHNHLQDGKVSKTVMIGGKKVRMDYPTLFSILERGRKVERRVLVGSSPLWQSLEPSLDWSYEVSLLQRVSRAIPPAKGSKSPFKSSKSKTTGNNQQQITPSHSNPQAPPHSGPIRPDLRQHPMQLPNQLPANQSSRQFQPLTPLPPHLAHLPINSRNLVLTTDANGVTKLKTKRGTRGGKKSKLSHRPNNQPAMPPNRFPPPPQQMQHQNPPHQQIQHQMPPQQIQNQMPPQQMQIQMQMQPQQQQMQHQHHVQPQQMAPPPSHQHQHNQAPTPALDKLAKQSKEQGVDELLHLKILESLLDYPLDPTSTNAPLMVLATGDANASDYNPTGFLGCVRRALERGWDVEILAFQKGTSSSWLGEQAKEAAEGVGRGKLTVVDLAIFAEELILSL